MIDKAIANAYLLLASAFFMIGWSALLVWSVRKDWISRANLLGLLIGLLLAALFYALKSITFSVSPLTTLILHCIFFSALSASACSDLAEMMVAKLTSIWLAPFFLCFSFFNLLLITPIEAALGMAVGFGLPWSIAKVFKIFKGYDGLGLGDMELLALIGAFLGPVGVIHTLNIASCSCLLYLLLQALITRKFSSHIRIPFAPFIALGGVIFLFYN